MKLDPIFTVKENKLYKLADNSLVDVSTLEKINISWSTVEIEPEAYNEEFLADLRNKLKALDEANKFAVLIPVVDKPLETPEDIELFINAFNHTARRVKDCISVAGLEIPAELSSKGFEPGTPAADFMETLAKKHAQYVYFAKVSSAPADIIVIE